MFKYYYHHRDSGDSMAPTDNFYRVDKNGNVQEIGKNLMNGHYFIHTDNISEYYMKNRVEGAKPSTAKIYNTAYAKAMEHQKQFPDRVHISEPVNFV